MSRHLDTVMAADKDRIAEQLIARHFEIESGITEIYRILSPKEASRDEPIKLLEINEETSETGKVDPFEFGASVEIPYACVIAEISPRGTGKGQTPDNEASE